MNSSTSSHFPSQPSLSLLQALEARRIWREKEQVSPHWWVVSLIIGDFMMAAIAAYTAYWLRFHTSFRDLGVFDFMTLRQYFGYMALGSISLVMVLGWQGLYHHNMLLRSRLAASKVAKSVVIWTMGFLAISLALKLEPSISRIYMALNGACSLIFILAWRRVFQNYLRQPSRIQALQQRTIFVGWNKEAHFLWNTLKRDLLI